MRHLRWMTGVAAIASGLVLTSDAFAQRVPIPPRAPAATQSPRMQPTQTWNTPRKPSKPFTNLYRTPTISPYLNLTRDDNDPGGLPNYFALVRPQLQQQEVNMRQQHSLDRLNREVEAVEARVAVPPGGDPNLRATGHSVYFQNYSHYYRR